MTEPHEQLELLKRGVSSWNEWREQRRKSKAIDLTKTDLRRTDLRNMDLRGVDFSHADLRWTNLSGARLDDADLLGARLRETVLADIDLTKARGLDLCSHSGPSVLDHRTLSKSKDLPLAFLRGCGLPDRLIEYLPALASEALVFYSCFISYSTKDQEFAKRLHADLQDKGVRCWFAPHDVRGGRKLHEQIDEAIRVYDKLLLILSDHSINSAWVKTEIANARAKEQQQKRQMLFPITLVPFDRIRSWTLFDADAGVDSAREIRDYFVPDFSNWKDHDSYVQNLQQLLRDLKANAAGMTAIPNES